MKAALLIFTLLLTFVGKAQSNCDSLVINCCDVSLFANDTLSLTATNIGQTEIFSYPGFKLLDATLTEVAVENVNYFGIGWGPQTHYMNVVQPISLPFTGTLQLWGGFYDTLYCEFPVTINTNGIELLSKEMHIYPNPVTDHLFIEGTTESNFEIYTMEGRLVKSFVAEKNSLNLSDLPSACYFLHTSSGSVLPVMFVKQ
jgi:hypothetical protein